LKVLYNFNYDRTYTFQFLEEYYVPVTFFVNVYLSEGNVELFNLETKRTETKNSIQKLFRYWNHKGSEDAVWYSELLAFWSLLIVRNFK
jgi:hypothetical protein